MLERHGHGSWFFYSRSLKLKVIWHFFKNSRDIVCLRIGVQKRKVYLKGEDQKQILLSKVGTGKELWSENLDPKRIVISKRRTGKIIFQSLLLRKSFFLVPSFEITFPFWFPILRHTLSLEVWENVYFCCHKGV